jgi:hypothetical protein
MAVALITITRAILDVRTATAHDADTQVTDAMITEELDQEYRNLRRYISQFAPTMYTKTYETTLAIGVSTITKPSDYERVVRLETRFSQGYYQPLAMRSVLESSQGVAVDVAGTYRLTYTAQPEDGYSTFDLPPGAANILVNYVAAFVCQRHQEDPSFFERRYEMKKAELRRDLVLRYGAHPLPAITHFPLDYGYRSFYEEGDHFVIM